MTTKNLSMMLIGMMMLGTVNTFGKTNTPPRPGNRIVTHREVRANDLHRMHMEKRHHMDRRTYVMPAPKPMPRPMPKPMVHPVPRPVPPHHVKGNVAAGIIAGAVVGGIVSSLVK